MKENIIEILEKHQLEDSTEDGLVIHPLVSFTEYEKIADEIVKLLDMPDVSDSHFIKFCCYVTGHDEATISQMYEDWKRYR